MMITDTSEYSTIHQNAANHQNTIHYIHFQKKSFNGIRKDINRMIDSLNRTCCSRLAFIQLQINFFGSKGNLTYCFMYIKFIILQ